MEKRKGRVWIQRPSQCPALAKIGGMLVSYQTDPAKHPVHDADERMKQPATHLGLVDK